MSNRGGVVINYWFITVKQCKIIKQIKNRAHKVVYLNTNDGSSDLEWAAWFS
jgi:general stress protein 26